MFTVLPLLASLATASAFHEPAAPAHNVIVIVLDDVGCDLIGAYDDYFQSQGRVAGVPANTPAIDQLMAARGVTFANAWTAPMCSPSRARLLTGRYGFRTGVGSVMKESDPLQNLRNPGLDPAEVLLPEVLHQASTPYACVAVGKWHLADILQLEADLRHPLGEPPGRWFDAFAGSMFNLVKPPGGDTQNVYYNWVKTYASALDPQVNPCPTGFPPCDVGMIAPPLNRYASVDTTDDALMMMQTLQEPYFLYVSYNAAHGPVHFVTPGNPEAVCSSYSAPLVPCDPGANPSYAARLRCVMETLDTQIGRLLCSVNEANTTVILLGDNGTDPDGILPPTPGNHGKGTIFEDGIRVPFIVRSPLTHPSKVGTVSTALVSSTDVFATVTAIAGVTTTAPVAQDSVSLLRHITGQPGPQRKFVYSEGFFPNFRVDPLTGWTPQNYSGVRHIQALRDRRFKLIRRWFRDHQDPNVITVTEEFFDLLKGGPLDTTQQPPVTTPDWFEQNDLLLGTIPAGTRVARSLAILRAQLDTYYPTLVD